MQVVENSYSCTFSTERRLKFLVRKMDELKTFEALPINDPEFTVKADMFFHKLRGTAATFDFMTLDALSIRATPARGISDQLHALVGECKILLSDLIQSLETQIKLEAS